MTPPRWATRRLSKNCLAACHSEAQFPVIHSARKSSFQKRIKGAQSHARRVSGEMVASYGLPDAYAELDGGTVTDKYCARFRTESFGVSGHRPNTRFYCPLARGDTLAERRAPSPPTRRQSVLPLSTVSCRSDYSRLPCLNKERPHTVSGTGAGVLLVTSSSQSPVRSTSTRVNSISATAVIK